MGSLVPRDDTGFALATTNMIISLTGIPGSGKTTIRNMLAEQLGLTRYSMGDVFGKLAVEHGMTIGAFNEFAKTKPEVDHQVDAYQTTLAEKEDNFIIDSRMAWHFIPRSFKVFLSVDLTVAAQRIYNAKQANPESRKDEPDYANIDEVKTAIEKRLAADNERYKTLYGVAYLDHENYDLVIDTTHTPPAEVAAQILAALPHA